MSVNVKLIIEGKLLNIQMVGFIQMIMMRVQSLSLLPLMK